MKPSFGHVSIPPPSKDQGPPRIFLDDNKGYLLPWASDILQGSGSPVRVKKKICSLLLDLWFPVIVDRDCCPIQHPLLPMRGWEEDVSSSGQPSHKLPTQCHPCPTGRLRALGLNLKEVMVLPDPKGWRSTSVCFLEKGFVGNQIPSSQKMDVSPCHLLVAASGKAMH